VQNCKDKFQHAKTYMIYGRELEQTVAEVIQAATQGNYSFFSERGVATVALTPRLAEGMMIDWRGAIASKKAVVADVFLRRYGEDIEQFVATPHNASRLIMANSYDAQDAILGLADWTQSKLTAADFANLRAELAQLRTQVDEHARRTADQLAQLTDLVARLAPG
jgi:hypothetical protein